MEENIILKRKKDANKFGVTVFNRKIWLFFAGGMNEPVKFQWKRAAYLDTSNPNNGKKIYNFEFS